MSRIVRIGLFKIDLNGNVILGSNTLGSSLTMGHDHRVIPDPTIPSSANYPTVKRFLELEALDDSALISMNQTTIITDGDGGGVDPPIDPPVEPAGFIFKIETTAPDQTFILPLNSAASYNSEIDWGDETPIDTITSDTDPDREHVFADVGVYTITATASFGAIYFNSGPYDTFLTEIVQFGEVGWTTFASAFEGCENLLAVPEGDLSGVTDFADAWSLCTFLATFSSSVDLSNGENFLKTWNFCYRLTSFPALDMSKATTVNSAWRLCRAMTSFGAITLTSVCTDFYQAWEDCDDLTSFPVINTSGGTDFRSTWKDCSSFTSFPILNLAAGELFNSTWQNNTSLTSFPALDLSSGTNFGFAWFNCNKLTSFPSGVDISAGRFFSNCWRACSQLASFPAIDMSSAESLDQTWGYCSAMTSFGLITLTSACQNFSNSWIGCSSLTSFPLINTNGGTNFGNAWNGCSDLTTFPLIDTSNGTNFILTWQSCSSLTSFPALNLNKGSNFSYAWRNCSNLTSFPANMFDTCPSTSFVEAWNGCALDETSMDNILVSLDTAGNSNGTVGLQGAPPSATGLAAIASLEGKGWTVTVSGVA